MLESTAPPQSAIDCAGAARASLPRCGDRHRSFVEPELSGAAHSRRLVCDPDPARRRFQKDPPCRGTLVLTSEDGVLGPPRRGRSASADRSSGALSRRRQCGVASGRATRSRPKPKWPTKRSINGASPTSAPAIPRRRCSEYLAWEIDLLPRIERDGSLQFSRLRRHCATSSRISVSRSGIVDHHIVAASHFVEAPGRIGFDASRPRGRNPDWRSLGADIALARNPVARAAERDLVGEGSDRLRRRRDDRPRRGRPH